MNLPAEGRTGGELMSTHGGTGMVPVEFVHERIEPTPRVPGLLRGLAEYAKASEQLLPEAERRGLYPAAGCEKHLERAAADTDLYPTVQVDQTAETDELDPLTDRIELIVGTGTLSESNCHLNSGGPGYSTGAPVPLAMHAAPWCPPWSTFAGCLSFGLLVSAVGADLCEMNGAKWCCVGLACLFAFAAFRWRR